MKKIFIGMFTMLFLIALVGAFAFGYLFLMKNNEAITLANDKKNLSDQLANVKSVPPAPLPVDKTVVALQTFEDKGIGFYIRYPGDWAVNLNTKLSDDIPNPFKQIESYTVNVTKQTASLSLDVIVSAQDGFPAAVSSTTSDYKDLGSKLVRFSEKGKNQWTYGTKLDNSACTDFAGGATFDICVGPFLPVSSVKLGMRGTLDASDASLIDQADSIVLSQVNK